MTQTLPERFDPARFNPYDPAFLADPYPFFAAFRAQAPVALVQPFDSRWVFRHADVKTVLESADLFVKTDPDSGRPPAPFGVLKNMPPGIFSMDPPRHDVLRALLDRLFPTAIADAAVFAEGVAQSLLAPMRAGARCELVSAYALPLPQQVLMKVLGVPAADIAGVGQWVSAVLAGQDIAAPRAAQAMAGTCSFALGAYFQALRRGCPMQGDAAHSLLNLMATQAEPQGMTAEEVQATAVNFAVAGYLSTVFLVATGCCNLLRQPEQLAAWRAQPALTAGMIDELMRYDTPFQFVDRYCAADTQLGGVALKRGDKVSAMLGSANRDETVFANPDRLDITRTDGHAQLGFGDGIHYCIGAPLARTVAPIALKALFDAFPTLRLAGIPQWQSVPVIRSVANLPLAFA